MIWESYPWKRELRRLARTIRAQAATARDLDDVDERREFKLERAIFYAAFVMRKLIESKKVTDKVAGHSVEVTAFKSRRPKAGNLILAPSTSCDLDKEYDLGREHKIRMSPCFLAEELIHSHKLMWDCNEKGCVVGIYVCSDRRAEDRLISLPI
jgi:hypothetical protein